jgi:hypothetical protein
MKKQILKIITIIGLIFSQNLFASTPPTPEEYQEIVDSFKLKDTSEKELSQTFRVNGEEIKFTIDKLDDKQALKNGQWQRHLIKFNNIKLQEFNGGNLVYIYDQKLFAVACIAKDKKTVLASIVRSSVQDYKEIHYGGLVSSIDKNIKDDSYVLDEDEIFKTPISRFVSINNPYNPKEFYPYFNEQRILARLYETGTCDKKATEQANIQVLVGDKWIPQEESWNIKETIVDTKTTTILPKKQHLYKSPSIDAKTKMYLIKGDKVEVLEEKDNWLHILYKGKKEIKAWIPKHAVEATE